MTVLRMSQGDDRVFTVTVTDSDGTAVDLSGSTLIWTARRSYTGAAVITKESGSGIETTQLTGEAEITLDSADTAGLPEATTDLLWDIQVTDGVGAIQTLASGVLRIRPDLAEAGGS